MSRPRAKLHLSILQAVFFSCFVIGVLTALNVNLPIYLVLAYGFDDVQRHGLYVRTLKPVLVVSNGDRAGELASFAVFVATLLLGFVIALIGIGCIHRLTGLLGRRVDILPTMDVLSKGIGPQAWRDQRGDFVFPLAALAITCAAAFLTIRGSLLHIILHAAVFVVITSIVLRLLPAGPPVSLESRPPP